MGLFLRLKVRSVASALMVQVKVRLGAADHLAERAVELVGRGVRRDGRVGRRGGEPGFENLDAIDQAKGEVSHVGEFLDDIRHEGLRELNLLTIHFFFFLNFFLIFFFENQIILH